MIEKLRNLFESFFTLKIKSSWPIHISCCLKLYLPYWDWGLLLTWSRVSTYEYIIQYSCNYLLFSLMHNERDWSKGNKCDVVNKSWILELINEQITLKLS